jgi:hypothetical protein
MYLMILMSLHIFDHTLLKEGGAYVFSILCMNCNLPCSTILSSNNIFAFKQWCSILIILLLVIILIAILYSFKLFATFCIDDTKYYWTIH